MQNSARDRDEKMPLESITALISKSEWRKEHPIFDVEPEVVEWARLHANMWLERWKKENRITHWPENEKRANYVGLIGHKCFELTLQQCEIPYIPNDPTIDWRGMKSYDFRVPSVGTIEIKTVDFEERQKRLLIKCSEWHDSDFVLAVKLIDELPTRAKFFGYATCEEVKRNFNRATNEWPCKKEPCFWQLLEKLNSASAFFYMLKNAIKNLVS
jgi:hypothetical protein